VGAEQQQRVFDIKEAVLNTAEPLLDICRRFFTPITNLRQIADGMRAACFTNESARCVNDYREQRIARMLEKAGQQVVRHEGRAYYVAQVLRCPRPRPCFLLPLGRRTARMRSQTIQTLCTCRNRRGRARGDKPWAPAWPVCGVLTR
jgi:hypothetical protein